MNWILTGPRLGMREITEADAHHVVAWRNTAAAREGFFSTEVVTPDSHRLFLANRKPHDLVFMFEQRAAEPRPGWYVWYDVPPGPLSMAAFAVDPRAHTAELGRFVVDPDQAGKGYAVETHYLMLCYAFDVLRLKSLWLEAFEANEAICKLDQSVGYIPAGKRRGDRGPVVLMTFKAEAWPEWKAKIEKRMEERK